MIHFLRIAVLSLLVIVTVVVSASNGGVLGGPTRSGKLSIGMGLN
jgi:hypothetical protein